MEFKDALNHVYILKEAQQLQSEFLMKHYEAYIIDQGTFKYMVIVSEYFEANLE